MFDANKKIKARSGKILQFKQPGDFYYRRGVFKHEKNKLLDAVVYYRRALELDPENAEIKLALAQILTEMNRFEESNNILMNGFDEGRRPSECYIGMGCNFMGMQDFERAKDSLCHYVMVEPDGEFSDEAYAMLDVIEDEDGFSEMLGEDSQEASEFLRIGKLGKDLIERNDFQGAIDLLSKAIEEHPAWHYVRNNLALAYFCARDFDNATKQVGYVLKNDPDNIQAHCNMALFAKAAEDQNSVQEEINFLTENHTEDSDDLNRIAVTLMELGQIDSAYKILKQLFRNMPYDNGITHRIALCCYLKGECKEAISYYDRLLKLDEDDSIASFYRDMCLDTLHAGIERRGLLFTYQVPFDEMVNRMHKLGEYIKLPRKELERLWHEDPSFCSMVLWGFSLPDSQIKGVLLYLIASFGDKKAIKTLRNFTLTRSQPDELKRDATLLLKRISGGGHIELLEDSLVENYADLMRLFPGGVPQSYMNVLNLCAASMKNADLEHGADTAIKIWASYLEARNSSAELNKSQIAAFAAALEFLAAKAHHVRLNKHDLCSKYGVMPLRFNNALANLIKAMEIHHDQ